MTSMVVEKPSLLALVNEARLHGMDRLTVKSLLYGHDLLSIDLINNHINILTTREEMKIWFEEAGKLINDPISNDLPDYQDLRTAILNTVLLPEKAKAPIIDELSKVRSTQSDPYRYPKQTGFGIDTNIAYFRLFSRLFQNWYINDIGLHPSEVQIFLSNIVEEEISRAISDKYSDDEIEALNRGCWDSVLIGYMFNICHKKGRKALNAQTEIDALSRMCNVWRIAGGVRSDDSEKNDDEIVSMLALHAANQRVDLIFVTGDDKCRAHAYSHKLPSVMIRYDGGIHDDIEFESHSLVEFLYDLSIIFVGLGIPELDLKIIGDWKGKSATEYHSEKVKLLFGNSSVIADELIRDLEIYKELNEYQEKLPRSVK